MTTAKSYASKHNFDASILREYDIRGTVGNTLKVEDCYFIGRGFGTILKRKGGKTIAVGFDGRESSPEFAEAAIQGLTDCGLTVEAIGLGPTPMAYYAMKSRGLDAAIQVTGSHSPLSYNGIKMTFKDQSFFGAAIQDLGKLVASGDFENGKGSATTIDIQDDYVDRLVKDYNGPKDLTVAWDNGNGAAGEILRRLVKKLPGKHILLFDEIDGTFPNHHPDPTVAKNLVDLQKAVRDNNADVGIGFDGDADRIGAVDGDGSILWADLLLTVYAQEVLKEHPGAHIIADVKCSRVLFDEITRLGGKPVMWITGHSLIKQKMRELKSPLAGELAGHICFADKYYGFDDGLYCAVRLLNILSQSGKSLAELTAHLPKMENTPEVRFHVPAERKFQIAPEIKERLKKEAANDIEVNDIDGVRVTTPDGWWLMRPSNTEDALTIRAEGFNEQGLERLKNQLIDQLKQSGIGSPF
ncbi:MAG TPA: phosphomannomutase/phosphoglucomutase [Patescibacteria group bacterium]|nr:phosphomannomutase/phosphoglucomutase [Patescibacteria group bacterium]